MLASVANFAATCKARLRSLKQALMCKSDELDDDDNLMWYKDLERHSCGDFSFAVCQANNELEDMSQVELGSNAIFVGVYDGHGGVDAARYINEHLFNNVLNVARQRNNITEAILVGAVRTTESGFMEVVRNTHVEEPRMRCLGSCCLVGIIFKGTLLLSNLGDSRAVIGYMNLYNKIAPEQLSVEHSANDEEIRRDVLLAHPNDPHILINKNGRWRVKGIIAVTRAIGDAFLKDAEFAADPAQERFQLPEPLAAPAISAEPSAITRVLTARDKFLIFASDGLWDHITNQEAVEIVHKNPRRGIARRLLKAAQKEAARKANITYEQLQRRTSGNQRRELHDDTTVVVVYINRGAIGQKDPATQSRSIKGFDDAVNTSQFATIDDIM